MIFAIAVNTDSIAICINICALAGSVEIKNARPPFDVPGEQENRKSELVCHCRCGGGRFLCVVLLAFNLAALLVLRMLKFGALFLGHDAI